MKINQLMEEGLNQELSKENSTEIETISVHNKEVKNMQAEEGFYRASRARGPGIKILSMTAVGSKEIKIGEATMPLLFIRQTSDIDVTVKNYSSQSKNGKVNIYINNDLVKTTSIHVSANQTTTLTVSLSLTGPGIHTLKIAVADLGGSSYHEESKDFYWAAMEGAAAKFEMIAPLNNYNEVGQEASFKVKIRNVGTINIPTLRLKFSEDGQVMLLGNLNLPGGALPPGYSVSFSVVYVAKTEGFHTVEFELDPDRTKLKNILGEDLIERDRRMWLLPPPIILKKVEDDLNSGNILNRIADLATEYRKHGADSSVVKNAMDTILQDVKNDLVRLGISVGKGVIGILTSIDGKYVVSASAGNGYYRDGAGRELYAQTYSIGAVTNVGASAGITLVIYPWWDTVDNAKGVAVSFGGSAGPAGIDLAVGSWKNLCFSVNFSRGFSALKAEAYVSAGYTVAHKVKEETLDETIKRIKNWTPGTI